MLKLHRRIFLCGFLSAFWVMHPVFAEDYGDYETMDIEITDFKIAGDGSTQTVLQYLDAKGFDAVPARHLTATTNKGAIAYSLDLKFPPALLIPRISLTYSSDSAMDREMPYGWGLDGICAVRRPRERAYNTGGEKHEWEFLVSGPGFSGTLKPSGKADYKWFMRSSGPNLVTAEYNPDKNDWTIFAEGITFHLSAKDDGADSPKGTALWRVDMMHDMAGNCVQYSYHDDGRIDTIAYGGNKDTGAEHLIEISFRYAANTVKRTDAGAGFVVEYKSHVTLITVGKYTGDGESSGSVTTGVDVKTAVIMDSGRFYAYDLVYTEKDAMDILTKLEREGESSDNTETIATFDYSEHEIAVDPARESSLAPSSLGKTKSWSYPGYLRSNESETVTVLADFNRDGLADVIDTESATKSNPQWKVTGQTVERPADAFSWNEPVTIELVDALKDGFQSSVAELISWGETDDTTAENYVTRNTVDVDGDGFLDILISGDAGEWTVYYGKNGGFTNGKAESPPSGWKYSQTAISVRADKIENTRFSAVSVLESLIDLNGDGWLDAFTPDGGSVYYHTGTRGGGWGAEQNIESHLEAMSSVYYTIAEETYEPNLTSYIGSACSDHCGGCEDDDGACESESDCESDCEDEMEDDVESQRQKYISATDETFGHYDINGDGLTDQISAGQTPWKVYLGNGHGFEDGITWESPLSYLRRSNEGRPDIHYEDSEYYINDRIEGSPAAVYQMLVDVNNDGLADLATISGKNVWYLNTGAGFETTPRDLPGWWPDAGFVISKSFVETDGCGNSTESTTLTSDLLADLDHDGVMDYVSVFVDDGVGAETAKIRYGTYPPPNRLIAVKNGQGGNTKITYRSLATIEPSGDWSKPQYTPNIAHLVDKVATSDAYNGQKAETAYSYADGYYADGVFQGFKSRTVNQSVNGDWTHQTVIKYELNRDFTPRATSQDLYVDDNRNYAPSLDRGGLSMGLRFNVTNEYESYGDSAKFFRLLKSRTVNEYGEGGADSSVKTFTQTYKWDNYGNLRSYVHDGGGVMDDAITVNFDYVNDVGSEASYDAKFYRMRAKTVTGIDPISGTERAFAKDLYYYDNNSDSSVAITDGFLTRTETQSGWVDGGEALSAKNVAIAYTRGDRGELSSVKDESIGVKIDQIFGFGGAILESQTNNLEHKITKTLDDEGRVTTITDPNGLVVTMTYDDFSRVTKKQVTDTSGQTRTVATNSYNRQDAPYYAVSFSYDGETGAYDTVMYSVEDGFGNPAQKWVQDAAGDYLVTNSIVDLRGLTLTTTHPQSAASFDPDGVELTAGTTLTQTHYDALGSAREVIRDKMAASGSQLVTLDDPWITITQDEKGYQTEFTYDAHKRLTKVRQGKSGTFTVTGKYRYDPLNRLVRFTDGKGTYYNYSYDGAGRLRKVSYGKDTLLLTGSKTSTTPTTWHLYSYKGALMTRMTNTTGAYAAWKYDDIGRPIQLTVSGALPKSGGGKEDALVYTWDYDDSWIGAIYTIGDPAGTTRYTYDNWGRESEVRRDYVKSSVADGTIAEFTYEHDWRGRLIAKQFPSTRDVTLDYDHGFLAKQSMIVDGDIAYTLNYDYNKWGMWDTATASHGRVYTREFTTPLWVDEVATQQDTALYKRSYTWQGNGLLSRRTDSFNLDAETSGVASLASAGSAITSMTGSSESSDSAVTSLSGIDTSAVTSGSTIYSYSYDNLKQLTRIKTPVKTIESYTYDAAGNPKTMQDASGVSWTYAAPTALNKIAKRTPSSGAVETYTYDKAGRIATRTDSSGAYVYYYDGMERLRGMSKDGLWVMTLDYDANGTLTRRGDNNPFESDSTYYTYSFRDWRYNEKDKTTVEFDNGFAATNYDSTGAATRTWLFREYDGHPAYTFGDDGTKTSSRNLGAYGAVIGETGEPWGWNTFHGSEDQHTLIHMGQRHLIQGQDQWLQPEPFLYGGIPADKLVDPISFSPYRYARNTPTAYMDLTGHETVYYTLPNDNKATFTSGDTYGSRFADLDLRPGRTLYSPSSNAVPQKALEEGLAGVSAGLHQWQNASSRAQRTAALRTIAQNIDPTLSIYGSGNCWNNVVAFWDTMGGEASVALPGSGHLDFSPLWNAERMHSDQEVIARVQQMGVGGGGYVLSEGHVSSVIFDGKDVRFIEGQLQSAGTNSTLDDGELRFFTPIVDNSRRSDSEKEAEADWKEFKDNWAP